MKNFLPLSILFFSLPCVALSSSVCDRAWKSELKQKTQVLCRLEWGSGTAARGIEWVKSSKSCGLEDEEPKDCLIARECHPERKDRGHRGNSMIRYGTPHESLCIGMNKKQRVSLFNRNASEGRVDLQCDENLTPKSVILTHDKLEKLCDFPKDFQ